MPEPLTPRQCDLRDFAFMPVDCVRLFASEFHALSSDTAWRAGVTLWLKSWHQVPAASLPDDEIQLTRLAELGRDVKTWRKIRGEALRGWVKCDDGRLYHLVVAEKALEAWLEKLVQRISSGAGNAKRWGAEFDQTSIEGQIDVAAAMLQAIAPQSKAIAKAKRRHSRTTPDKNSTGTPAVIPSGSQGTGTGTGTGNLILPLSDDNGGDGSKGAAAVDPEKVLFDQGVALLGKAGVGETKARPMLGKWKRDHGAANVISALARAQREGAIEPVAFIEGCLKALRKNETYDRDRLTV